MLIDVHSFLSKIVSQPVNDIVTMNKAGGGGDPRTCQPPPPPPPIHS